MARPRKARVEGEAVTADPVPGNNGDALSRIVEFFKAEHPDVWAEIALCPLQHGLEVMADRLK